MRIQKQNIKCLIFLILLIVFSGSASAKDWDKGGGDNDWSNPLNWNPNGVPAGSDNVNIRINTAGQMGAVIGGEAAVCNSIRLAGNVENIDLQVTGGSLTVQGLLMVSEESDLSQGHMQVAGGTVQAGVGTATDTSMFIGFQGDGRNSYQS